MTIPYEKQFVKSDGRRLNRSGPRDMQARAADSGYYTQDSSLIELLTNQITGLRAEILTIQSRGGDKAPTGFFSPEQVDEEIRKAVEAAVAEMAISFKGIGNKDAELKNKISKLEAELGDVAELKKQIAVLEQEVVGKQELVDTLRTRTAIVEGEVIDPDRPQIEQVFVDPLEKNAGEGMKPSISIETIVKEDIVDDKVNKLKDLLGKLPAK